MIFLTLVLIENVAFLQVRTNELKNFPLTKRGCIAAGRYLRSIEAETWLYSSSADFPREYKRHFRYDVRELVAEGYAS